VKVAALGLIGSLGVLGAFAAGSAVQFWACALVAVLAVVALGLHDERKDGGR
jgi:hypothetical protein